MSKSVSYAGAAALVLGLFTPVMKMPIVGNINLFANGQNLIGLALLALGAVAGGLALKDRDEDVIWPGAAALAILVYSFLRIEWTLVQMRQSLAKDLAGNPFANLAQAAASSIQIQWGSIALIGGAVALVYAGAKSRKRTGRSVLSIEDGAAKLVAAICLAVCVLVIGWDIWTKNHDAAPPPAASTANNLDPTSPASRLTHSTSSPEEARYAADHVKIYDLKAKYYDSLLDGRIPGVDFKVKNDGDRTLSEVDVRVIFYDAQGKPIGEEIYYPVLVTSDGFGEDNKPLRPNYIWRNEVGKFYSAKSIPSEWATGKVSAQVTKIEFAPN